MGTQPSRVPVVGSPYEQDPAWADPSLTHHRALWVGLLLTRQCLSTYEAHNLKNIRGSQAVRDESSEASGHRHVGSRVLHALDRWATKPTLALSVVTTAVTTLSQRGHSRRVVGSVQCRVRVSRPVGNYLPDACSCNDTGHGVRHP